MFLDDDERVGPDFLLRYRLAPEGIRMGRIDFEFDATDGRKTCRDHRWEMEGPDRLLQPWEAFEETMWGGNCAVPTELGLALGGLCRRGRLTRVGAES